MCQSLHTMTQSSPGPNGSARSDSSAAMLNSRKRCIGDASRVVGWSLLTQLRSLAGLWLPEVQGPDHALALPNTLYTGHEARRVLSISRCIACEVSTREAQRFTLRLSA